MHFLRHQNVQIDLLKKANDTFLLHQLQNDISSHHSFTLGEFFNRQMTGFRIQDLESDDSLKKWITPIATIRNSANYRNDPKHNITDDYYNKKHEFVAIAEGIDLPLYIFTYNIEMTQFVHTNLLKNSEQKECIDKSILARHHAQFISHQIADEARLNDHKYDMGEPDYERLVRHHKLISVQYEHDTDKLSSPYNAMPEGLDT